MSFSTSVTFVLAAEGGYSDNQNDFGGPTNFGISQWAFEQAKNKGIISGNITNLTDLTRDSAVKIYHEMYWKEYGINLDAVNKISSDVATVLFDMSVNSGRYNAVTTLQNLLGVDPDGIIGPQTLEAIRNYNGDLTHNYIASRQDFYNDIIANNPSQAEFGSGWSNRLFSLRGYLVGNSADFADFIIDDGVSASAIHDTIESILPPPTSPDSTDNTYRIVYYDPLVLDLDGDGIETVSGAQGSGVLFDQNADGIRTTSGWLKGDDGLLVRDINGNGTIETGAELFGDSTRLANGATAANGFAALADLDSNQDGQVNNQDSAFNELRVWRDGDQDGVTDTGELFSLDEVGVSSLNTEVSATPNITLTGGIQAETGSFTRADGSTGTMADMNFTEDTFRSQYTTGIDIPVELQNLPNIAGMGRLRDLREAAALSPALANALGRCMYYFHSGGAFK